MRSNIVEKTRFVRFRCRLSFLRRHPRVRCGAVEFAEALVVLCREAADKITCVNLRNLWIMIPLIFSVFTHAAPVASDPLRDFLADFNSMQAGFIQIQMDSSGRELERMEGTLYLQQPGKFHWFYEKPFSQKIITDGESLWVFDEDLEQVTIRNMADIIEQTPAGIILNNADIDRYFVQAELGRIDDADWIEFTPKNTETQYKNIRFGFDGGKLLMMIIADNLGQLTRIDFRNVSRHPALSPGLFTFEIPNGVDVIDERQPPKNPPAPGDS